MIVRNTTNADIELFDFGKLIAPNEIKILYGVSDNDVLYSPEFQTHIKSGTLVIILFDGSELTITDSISHINNIDNNLNLVEAPPLFSKIVTSNKKLKKSGNEYPIKNETLTFLNIRYLLIIDTKWYASSKYGGMKYGVFIDGVLQEEASEVYTNSLYKSRSSKYLGLYYFNTRLSIPFSPGAGVCDLTIKRTWTTQSNSNSKFLIFNSTKFKITSDLS